MMAGGIFSGRLGLEAARMPHADRHGLLWLSHGRLFVEDGTLHFSCGGADGLQAGDYSIPYQGVSIILMGPGTSVTHDALRILARHSVLLAAVGMGGVKFYSAPPYGSGRSVIARTHARLWAASKSRVAISKRMYGMRFGSEPRYSDLETLRGIEGARMKEVYKLCAERFSIEWHGRRYDRMNPEDADLPNQAINHSATFVESAADVAVAAIGAIPPLGFIHESSSNAFTLDVADLFRASITIPIAFSTVRDFISSGGGSLEREIRYRAAETFRREQVIPAMIDQIKELFGVDDHSSH